MSRRFIRSDRLSILGLLTSGLALGACGSPEDVNGMVERNFMDHGNWEQLDGSFSNRVESVTIEHAVSFPASRAELDQAERRRLVEFLQASSIGGADEVALVGSQLDPQATDPITAARMAYLKEELAAFGIAATGDTRGGGYPQNQVAIVVDRTIVITPDCGQSQPVHAERPKLQSGCADTANLGLMVADPRDLAQGVPLGPADGDHAALSVDKYRKGEIEHMPEVFDTEVTSSTGENL